MMAVDGALSFSVMENVLQEHNNKPRHLDLDSRRAEEVATRRYEATTWMRNMIGVDEEKDLPTQPSEEEFRLALRSGLILCNVINKVDPGSVPKVVEGPCDSVIVPDGAALCIYQCFENVRNFLVAVEQMGLPTFEASDLEQGGKSTRIVNCILALKSYNDWKQAGANGVFKFGGNLKPITSSKIFIRKNSEPFKNSLSKSFSMKEVSMNAQSLESVLNKVMEEFENRVANQLESDEDEECTIVKENQNLHEENEKRHLEYQMILDIQERYIKGEHTENTQGVNYRALRDLFLLAEQRKDTFQYDVSVQMIEIYNEQVRDLLVADGSNKKLEIHNNSQNGFNVPNANLIHVASMHDVINLMNIGQRNRVVGATALNDRSSRSHSCLTVHVQGIDLTSGSVLRGCMHLVDLAGSERMDKSEVTGDRLKEAQHINKSLSALGDVISSLAQKNSHVPYRNSKLTQLLQDSLGGQAKTLMFVHISPELNDVGETLSTLKFAERVATVELGAAQVHRDSSHVKKLKEQIANLKAALAKKEGDQEDMQHKVYGSPSGKMSSRSPPSLQRVHSLNEPKSCRKPKADKENFEASKKSRSRQKTQSFDLEELLSNSPPWPPISSTSAFLENDTDTCSSEWVDKVMVNKQDEATSNAFYQKSESGFDLATADSADEVDASTNDSCEHDLLWHFNHSRLSTMSSFNGNAIRKKTKSPDLRSMIPRLLPSPTRKSTNANNHPQPPMSGGRQLSEIKKKTGNRKL